MNYTCKGDANEYITMITQLCTIAIIVKFVSYVQSLHMGGVAKIFSATTIRS